MKKALLLLAFLLMPVAGWGSGDYQMILQVGQAKYLHNDPANAPTREVDITGVVASAMRCTQAYADRQRTIPAGILTCPKHGEAVHFSVTCRATAKVTAQGNPPLCPDVLSARFLRVGGFLPDSGVQGNPPQHVEIFRDSVMPPEYAPRPALRRNGGAAPSANPQTPAAPPQQQPARRKRVKPELAPAPAPAAAPAPAESP